MNTRTLGALVVLLFVLTLVLFLVEHAPTSVESGENVLLLGDVDADRIAKVVMEQGTDKVELVLSENGQWVVPTRAGYPVEEGKLRSLLFRLFELKASQKIGDSEAKHGAFGVAESSVREGRTRIGLFDREGKELAALIFGDSQKRRGSGLAGSPAGQYVRRVGQSAVFIAPEKFMLNVKPIYWLDLLVLNVLESSIEGVLQYALSDGREELQFELHRMGEGKQTKLLPVGLHEGVKVQESTVSELGSALENLRFTDVFAENDPVVTPLTFNRKTVFRVANGLVYTVLSAEGKKKDGHEGTSATTEEYVYVRVEAKFDPELVKEVQGTRKKEDSAPPEASPVSPGGNQEEVEEEGKEKQGKQSPVVASSSEEAAEINKRLKPWVFALVKVTGDSFRISPAKLFEQDTAPPS